MSDFLARMKAAAKAYKKTIVLPEGEDPRTIEAARKIVEEDLANLVILGDPAQIDVEGVTVIDPTSPTAPKHEAYAQKFAELRAKKGVTIEQARAQMMDATYYGTMMVKMGDADGLVSGACHSTANTLRPALQILKTAPGTKLVSAFMVMCTKTPQFGADGTLVFADCGLNIDPTSDELSEIAIASANSFATFMDDVEPRVAMLSYSTMGSAGGDTAKKVQEATALARPAATRPRRCRRPRPLPRRRRPSSPSTATCSSTPPSCPRWPPSRPPTARWPATPTCWSSPTSRPATSATSSSSALATPRRTAPSCRASPSR